MAKTVINVLIVRKIKYVLHVENQNLVNFFIRILLKKRLVNTAESLRNVLAVVRREFFVNFLKQVVIITIARIAE